jgi:uncharacterized protein YdiU (UPF0061 family)
MSNKLLSRKKPSLLRQTPDKSTGPDQRSPYYKFDSLDGTHPWQEKMPEGFVPYQVRTLPQGEVIYFNFDLAKEMGLIPEDHKEILTKALSQKLKDTFALQIINEYDLADPRFQKRLDPTTVKPKPYMATRYLQLQHPDKTGRTSGDGRGIWNGVVEHKGKTWDVSSRGTGVTRLAPGAVEAQKPLRTGDEKYGYGCGLAEIDELLAAAISAEVMHLQGISTERVLCLIDLGNGHGIGVRAGQNLLRPAHLFRFLKQGKAKELKAGLEYFVERQIQNGRLPREWKPLTASFRQKLLFKICDDFASFAAKLEVDYIFAWLDWDGDNVLLDAGIIDYGSIRQFGICHDQYRYDDVTRFSTNLTEQKSKAKLTIQAFAQMMDLIATGHRLPLQRFSKASILQRFEDQFDQARKDRFLYRLGLDPEQRKLALRNIPLVQEFQKEFEYFERAKVSSSAKKVADGINQPALFNMRKAMALINEHIRNQGLSSPLLDAEQLFKNMVSNFAKSKPKGLRPKHKSHLLNLQALHRKLLQSAFETKTPTKAEVRGLCERALTLNANQRMTGNALIAIVNSLLEHRQKGLPADSVQKLIDQLIHSQMGMPETDSLRKNRKAIRSIVEPDIFSEFVSLMNEFCEDI